MIPEGSKAAREGEVIFRRPEQLGERRSHTRTVSSRLQEMNWSSTGDTSREVTRRLWPLK